MGTTLTGTTPQDTYDSLIKVTDNGPLSGSLKTLTDGLGNDSALALSTGAASVTGALSVSLDGLFGGSTNAGNAGTNTLSVGVAGTTAGGLQLWAANNQTHFIQFGDGTSGAQVYAGLIGYAHSDDALYFGSAATERMRINSAGNVGIGTSSPTTTLDVAGTGRIKSSVGDYLLTIENIQDDSQGLLVRASDNDSLPILKLQSSVGATSETWVDRFVVNKDGNVGIGTSSPSQKLDVAGRVNAAGDDYHSFSVDQGSAQIRIERTGTSTGVNYIGSDNRGLVILNSAFSTLAIFTANGLTFNGDTAAANALDDYEEGTFTPTMSGATFAYATQSGFYTKIGRQVSIFIDLEATYSSPTATFTVNLPFTVLSPSRGEGVVRPITGVTFTNYVTCEAIDTSLYFENCFTSTGSASTDMNSTNFNSAGFRFFASITFFV
jgi:hypothetical protein